MFGNVFVVMFSKFKKKNMKKNNIHNEATSANDTVDENLNEATVVEPEVESQPDETTETASESDVDEEVDAQSKLEKQLEETKAALEKEKKEYLFLMADFDNFRKRVLREKAELIKNGAEKALKGILPIVDDFERGLEASKAVSDAESIRQGMELIYSKLVKYLSDNGVKAMETTNAVFDPEIHEAVAMVPAADESQKGLIIDTTQKGYTLNDKVLRHAKVVVAQ